MSRCPSAALGESCALVLNLAVARRDEQSPSRLRSQPPQLPSLASGAVEKRSPSQAFAPFRGRSTSRVNVDHACLSLACGSTPLPTLTGFLQFSRLESWASGHGALAALGAACGSQSRLTNSCDQFRTYLRSNILLWRRSNRSNEYKIGTQSAWYCTEYKIGQHDRS